MNERKYALFGVVGPLVAYLFIGVSIVLSPWFSWWSNALSDLGHFVDSDVASLYNFGLLLAGFFIIIYSITAFRNHAKYSSCCLLVSALILQLVATFDEVYGSLHVIVSILLFVSLGLASIVYAVERKSVLALAAFVIGLGSWILYWAGMYSAGVAVPETISSVVTVSWVMLSAIKIYLGKSSR
ncbi:MAG: DUF998 domain-containing protein [Candidatus Bathyarchaeota archaeon]|nr:DUF998 domain-containing protein [Candidatus Bathyarchaeota archaeon]MDH5419332.1 DUF998 domain-containing protein [Candidatus Bathyarchaeota archaeon]